MAMKNLVLLIAADQSYIRHGIDEKRYAPELGELFESISDLYLPMLNMFSALERDNIPFKIVLVLPPVLCTLLSDPVVQKQYISWLDRRIELGKKELERCSGNQKLVETVKLCLEKAQEDRIDFVTVYEQNILKQILSYQKKGKVELLATCGTDIFLPHFSDMEEVLNAQIETGLQAYRCFFGEMPSGFWLPQLGYCEGVDKALRSYGIDYTVLDARSFLFSETEPTCGIFVPARCGNSLGVFARDSETDGELFGEDGFASNDVYRNQNRDIGFELPLEKLSPYLDKDSPRCASGYCYWKKQNSDSDEDDAKFGDPSSAEDMYDAEQAMQQCTIDAAEFISRKCAKLAQAESLLPEQQSVSLICTFSTDQFRQNWYEGISWVEQLFRNAVNQPVQFSLLGNLISGQYALQKIRPYYGASSGAGYGENLLSNKNSWMIRYVRKASERMIDLAERFPDDTGLKARLLNLGAKELILAQSSGWERMLDSDCFPEYADQCFRDSIVAFTTVFDSLGSNTVSTEWLTNLEAMHPLFPWMNYRIFSRKR